MLEEKVIVIMYIFSEIEKARECRKFMETKFLNIENPTCIYQLTI
jgi:hypothetical protein